MKIRYSAFRRAEMRSLIWRVFIVWALLSPAAVAQDPFGAANPFGSGQNDGGSTDPFTTGGDPFGSGADPFGAGQADAPRDGGFEAFGQSDSGVAGGLASSGSQLDEEDPDPVVRLLRAQPPQSPRDMADALTWMARIKRWDEVRRLLDSLAAKNWPLPRKAELARAAGPSLWTKIRGEAAGLSEEQKRLTREILAAPSELARNPAWIDSWVQRLQSASAGERRLAQLRLQDAGWTAVERLVAQLSQGGGSISASMLAGTIVEFGKDGEDALRVACTLGDPGQAGRVVLALATLPGSRFTAELAAGLESGQLSPETQAQLQERLLKKHGALPDVGAIHAYLSREFQRRLSAYQTARMEVAELTNRVWRLAPDRSKVQIDEVPADQRELELLASLAAQRLKLRTLTTEEAVECGAALLQRAYQVDRGLSLGEIESRLMTRLPGDYVQSDGYWQRVFARAGEWQMHGAALRSVQMLGEQSNSTSSSIEFLSQLLSDSRPSVRFSALAAIEQIDPLQPFSGSSRAVSTALEMSRLERGPRALVIGLMSDLRQAARDQLQAQLDAEVTTANSTRAALAALNGDRSPELIFIVDRVADQSIFELLQRLRGSRRGHSLPIAVLTDELYAHERDFIESTPGILSSVLSRNPQQMQRVVTEMLSTLDTEPMTPEDRGNFARVAQSFLVRIAGDPQRYDFYPTFEWSKHLISTATRFPAADRAELLSGMPSQQSQQQLVGMAAQQSLTAEDRLQAARGFAHAVKRFGMNLDREQVLNCYALYNRLGPNDPVAVRAMGHVLDVLEAHAGKAPWPDDDF